MADVPMSGSPMPTPPPPHGRTRPWWGPIDVLLAVVFVIAASFAGQLIAVMIAVADGVDFDSDFELPVYGLVLATLFLQAGQGIWPLLVSRWKGLGIRQDWRFEFSLPADLGYGFLLAIACVVGAGIVTEVAATLVGLENTADASNTNVLSDNDHSPWIIGIIILVVFGAPLVEELLFRGLVLRTFEKAFGTVAAIIGSTLIFALPHIQADATWQESVVLLSSIAMIGFILAIGAVRIGRLGAPIIAHLLFNGFGTVATLVF